MKKILKGLWEGFLLVLFSGGFLIVMAMRMLEYSYDEAIPVAMIYYLILFIISVFVASWRNNRR